MSIERFYKTVTIQRATPVDDPYGGTTYTYSTHLTTTGLINKPKPAVEQNIADKYQIRQPYNFYTATGQDIKQDDRVVDSDGVVHRIVSNPDDTVGRGHHYWFILERLDSDG